MYLLIPFVVLDAHKEVRIGKMHLRIIARKAISGAKNHHIPRLQGEFTICDFSIYDCI